MLSFIYFFIAGTKSVSSNYLTWFNIFFKNKVLLSWLLKLAEKFFHYEDAFKSSGLFVMVAINMFFIGMKAMKQQSNFYCVSLQISRSFSIHFDNADILTTIRVTAMI